MASRLFDGIRAAGKSQVRAQRLRQFPLVRAARNADDRRASRFRQLHVQLPGDAQAHHHDCFAGENIDQSLRVHTRGQNLDQRRGLIVDRSGRAKHVAGGRDKVFGEAAVGVAPKQLAVGAKVRLPDAAVKAQAAEKFGIDDDAVASLDEWRLSPASATSPIISWPMIRG